VTTIAYRDGIMAADRMVTGNGIYDGDVTKIMRLTDGTLFGASGASHLKKALITWIESGMAYETRPKDFDQVEFEGILVKPNGSVFFIEKGFTSFEIDAEYVATGSGRELALGAMAFGATAEQAIDCASKHDTKTGNGKDVLLLFAAEDFGA
jgi:20S proteasome alpha/beta subunit